MSETIQLPLIANTASSTPCSPDRTVPLLVAADQAYYWSVEWQEDEAEARADLAAGRYRDFDNADDAIAWLTEDAE